MQYYRCRCGDSEFYGSMSPPRCMRCAKCDSNLALGPERHREPVSHDYSAHIEQIGEHGMVQIPVCRYCWRARWQVDDEARRDAESVRDGHESTSLSEAGEPSTQPVPPPNESHPPSPLP